MVANTYNTSTWEVEAGGSRIHGQPQLLSKFEASLGYLRVCLNAPERGTETDRNSERKNEIKREKETHPTGGSQKNDDSYSRSQDLAPRHTNIHGL